VATYLPVQRQQPVRVQQQPVVRGESYGARETEWRLTCRFSASSPSAYSSSQWCAVRLAASGGLAMGLLAERGKGSTPPSSSGGVCSACSPTWPWYSPGPASHANAAASANNQ
jgi:hypothetical protein